MRSYSLKLFGKDVRTFTSIRQFLVYANELLMRGILLFACGFIAIAHEFIEASSPDLAKYVLIYIIAVMLWGLLILKFIISGKKVFGKTKYDMFFMGLLTFFLISVLLSDYRIDGVFGSFGTWSYSVITLLAISIIYYVAVLTFKYSRGIKWVGVAHLLSVLIPSIYFIILIVRDLEARTKNIGLVLVSFLLTVSIASLFKAFRTKIIGAVLSFLIILGGAYYFAFAVEEQEGVYFDFLKYAVLSIPLIIANLFVFKKIFLRLLAFVTLLFNLFLIAYYTDFLGGTMFVLGIGVLSLFLLFYFSFWVRNSRLLMDFFKNIRGIRTIIDLKKSFREDNKKWLILLMVIFMALWILGFSYYNYTYYRENVGPFLLDWIRDDTRGISGFRNWLFGSNNLSYEFSSLEMLNILGNFGLVTLFIYIVFWLVLLKDTVKLILELLYSGSFRNIIWASGIFISIVTIILTFILSRFSPMIFMILLYVVVSLSIVDGVIKKSELYRLPDFKEKLASIAKVIRILASILVIAFTVVGVIGILSGLTKNIF